MKLGDVCYQLFRKVFIHLLPKRFFEILEFRKHFFSDNVMIEFL